MALAALHSEPCDTLAIFLLLLSEKLIHRLFNWVTFRVPVRIPSALLFLLRPGLQWIGSRDDNITASREPFLLILRINDIHGAHVLLSDLLLLYLLSLHVASKLLEHLVDFGILLAWHHLQPQTIARVQSVLDAFCLRDSVPDIRLVVVFVLHGDLPHPNLELVALFSVRHGGFTLAISHLAVIVVVLAS